MGTRGTKSSWLNTDTKTIRVPVRFAAMLRALAVGLDALYPPGAPLPDDEWQLLPESEYQAAIAEATKQGQRAAAKGFKAKSKR